MLRFSQMTFHSGGKCRTNNTCDLQIKMFTKNSKTKNFRAKKLITNAEKLLIIDTVGKPENLTASYTINVRTLKILNIRNVVKFE